MKWTFQILAFLPFPRVKALISKSCLEEIRSGITAFKKAKEIANPNGKIILPAKVQLDYNNSRKYNRKIDFLNCEAQPKEKVLKPALKKNKKEK